MSYFKLRPEHTHGKRGGWGGVEVQHPKKQTTTSQGEERIVAMQGKG
jgi:hypothetical protein